MVSKESFAVKSSLTRSKLPHIAVTSVSTVIPAATEYGRDNDIVRQERQKQLGIDCHDEITWRNWEVGREYEKKLIIKNTHEKLQVIRYKLPRLKGIFFLDYPEPVSWCSGMPYSLVVKFRPIEMIPYHDEMEVEIVGRGSFFVKLNAFTPYSELTAPDHHDSGMCPVNIITSDTFTIKNTGTMDLHFEWDVPAPFSLHPKVASLKMGEHLDMTISFLPKEATAVVAQAVCKVIPPPKLENNNGDPIEERPGSDFMRRKEIILATVRFSGIGKYAFIQMKKDSERTDLGTASQKKSTVPRWNQSVSIQDTSTSKIKSLASVKEMSSRGARDSTITPVLTSSDPFVIDFGEALTLTSHVRYITLVNPSHVDANFTLRRLDRGFLESPFFITPMNGMIAKNCGEQCFTIRFNPKNSGARYTSDYIVDSQSCCTRMKFRLTGVSIGPNVTLSTSYLDFGGVDMESICGEEVNVKHGKVVGNVVDSSVSPIIQLDRFISLNNTSELPQRFQFFGMETGGAFTVTPSFGFMKSKGSVNIKVSFTPASTINYLRRIYLLTSMAETAQILDVFGTGYTSKSHPAFFNINDVNFYFAKIGYGLGGVSPTKTERLITDILNEENGKTNNSSVLNGHDGVIGSDGEELPEEQDTAAREALKTVMKTYSEKRCRKINLAAVSESTGEGAPGSVTTLPFIMDTSLIIVRHEGRSIGQSVTIRNTTSTKAIAVWALPHKKKNINKEEISNSDPDIEGFDQTELQPWYVIPESAEILPFESVTFTVQLSHAVAPLSFCASLECFVYFKVMRSFRLINEHSFIPPQCLTLHCLHLAPYRENGPIPQVSLPVSVSFPPSRVKGSVYQLVEFRNQGDTAVGYSIETGASMLQESVSNLDISTEIILLSGDVPDNDNPVDGRPTSTNNESTMGNNTQVVKTMDTLDEAFLLEDERAEKNKQKELLKDVFHCFPTAGIIPANGSALILARFSPTSVSCFMGVAKISYNGALSPSASILLKGEGFAPKISLESNGKLFFRPTTVRGTTTRYYTVQNLSRIPVSFETHIPDEFSDVVQLSHTCGTLQGSEKISILASFTPNEVKKYTFQIPFNIFVPDDMGVVGSGEETEEQLCTIEGQGFAALLAIEPMSCNMEGALVGSTTQKTITISNTGLSDAAFQLRYLVHMEGNEKAHSLEGMVNVEFGPSSIGSVRARTHHSVSVRITLVRRGNYNVIVYALASGDISLLRGMTAPTRQEIEERLPHCTFSTKGEHGILQFADVRCVYQQKSHLWRQMNIPSINAHLSESISDADRDIRLHMFEDAINELDSVSCYLGVDIYHAAPITIIAALENKSPVPVSFDFRFPLDNDIPKEPWHVDQRGLDDPVAIAIDHELFDIQPRSGTIHTGGHQIIKFQYFHKDLGDHSLPVILRVDGNEGKQVLLNLQGTTNVIETKHLAFRHNMRHEILPVAIGDLDPPIQYTEIQNLSRQSVCYTIDGRCLDAIKSANYDFPVLQCLNPKGMIPAMSTLLLSWFFRPIEVKTYEIPLRVVIEGGETYDITLVGSGYHPMKISALRVREMYEKETFYMMPMIPFLEHPSLPLRLSMDVMNFGSVPFHSLHRRHVNLLNSHKTDTFLYEWRTVLQHGDQILEIEPPAGEIGPGESVHFRLTMFSGSTSHVIDTSIHCHVLNKSLQKRRKLTLARVNKAANLEMTEDKEFTKENSEGETNDSVNLALSLRSERVHSYRKCLTRTSMKSGLRQPITTIPPKYQSIGTLRNTIESLAEAYVSHNIDENADEMSLVDVTPTIVELVLQARVMPSEKYAEIYGEDSIQKIFFPTLLPIKALGRSITTDTVMSDKGQHFIPVSSSETSEGVDNIIMEKDMAMGCITEMLKQLMHQSCVRDALVDPRDDTPYYCEMISSCHKIDSSSSSTASHVREIDVASEPQGECITDAVDEDTVESVDSDKMNNICANEITINIEQVYDRITFDEMNDVQKSPHYNVTNIEKKEVMGPFVDRTTIKEEPPSGSVQCVAEEVIEEALYGLITNALSFDGVISGVLRGGAYR